MAWIFSGIAGCALLPPTDARTEPAPAAPPAPLQWWDARFPVAWPTGKAPAWHLDAFVAHRVVSPLLDAHTDRIPLWRFHRRAVRDDAGHRFRFLFFSDEETARAVFEGLAADPRLGRLVSAGLVGPVQTGAAAPEAPDRVEATSDPRWPDAVQRAWPRYIMGVSAMWLGLIAQTAEEAGAEAEEDYISVHEEVTRLWREDGGHAFLHHLSAVFAYEPLYLVERRLIGF
jgi:hypothetical protein